MKDKKKVNMRRPILIGLCVIESLLLLVLLLGMVGIFMIESYAKLTGRKEDMYKGGDWASEEEFNASEENNPDIHTNLFSVSYWTTEFTLENDEPVYRETSFGLCQCEEEVRCRCHPAL